MVHPLWKTVWRFLETLKIELPYDPAIPLLGIYLKKKKILRVGTLPAHCWFPTPRIALGRHMSRQVTTFVK